MHNKITDTIPSIKDVITYCLSIVAIFTITSFTGCEEIADNEDTAHQATSQSDGVNDINTSVITEHELMHELEEMSEKTAVEPPFYEEKDGNIVITFNEHGFDVEYIYIFDEAKRWTALDVKLIPGKISSLEEMCWESAFPLDASEFTEEDGCYIAHSNLFAIPVDDRTTDGAIDNAESRITEYKLLNEWRRSNFDTSGSSGFSGLGNNTDVEKGEFKVEARIVPAYSRDISIATSDSEIRVLVKTRKDYVPDNIDIDEKDIKLIMSADDEDIELQPDSKDIFIRDNEIIIWAYAYRLESDKTFDQIAVSVDTETGPEITVFSYYELFE